MKRILMAAILALGIGYAATLPYQGLATDAKNNPKADGLYAVDFAFYSASSGGTALWNEPQTVTTSKGLFSTTLGSTATIPDSLFHGSALYLGVKFDGGAEGGRVLLGTTPWATAAGKSATSAYADSAGKVKGLLDSLAALRSALAVQSSALTDSTKALRDTVTNLRSTIASQATTISGMNTTLSSQSVTITSLSSSVDALQTLLLALNNGVAWNSAVTYGYLKDSRDGQVYRTVAIGTQTWMAQNLNYRNATGSSDTVGVCYNNSADSCAKYGRLYTWAQVMNGSTSSATSPSGVQGICPTGWHVPSDAEWQSLEVTLGMSAATAATIGWRGTTEGTKLKSTSGWTANTGTDTYGFRALPGGNLNGTSFYSVGYYGTWWSATESAASYAWYRNMLNGYANVGRNNISKTIGFSLRCVKD